MAIIWQFINLVIRYNLSSSKVFYFGQKQTGTQYRVLLTL